MMNCPLIVITGPTATGKTALGVELALRLGGEVVSADSMQIYRGMDVGTAKPRPEETKGVPHRLIDEAEPEENWSVAMWTERAVSATEDMLRRGVRPLVVGGTGLYISSLLYGRSFSSAPYDPALRRELDAEYERLGGEGFRELLRREDPERAEKLPPGDRKRLVRAREVYLLTGETITELERRTREAPVRYASLRFALTWRDREALYRRIRERVDAMVSGGLFEEVEALFRRGVDPACTAMQAIGYKEVAAALRGETSPEEAVEAVKLGSCRYAKRQLTWLRRDEGLYWLAREDFPDTASAAEEILRILRKEGYPL